VDRQVGIERHSGSRVGLSCGKGQRAKLSETISELRRVNKSFAFRDGLLGKHKLVRAVKDVSLQIKKRGGRGNRR
jgi:ABC-type glutathione transport system ATPase component